MSGLHPCYVDSNYLEEISIVEDILNMDKSIVAIGEIGIDLHWDKSNLDIQLKAFERQIILANDFGLPIVIHCRESFDEIYNVLNKLPAKNEGIFHCFTGTLDQANKIISMGMKIGIGGVVTFKNGNIDKFLKNIDIKNIVLETDSPYLSPKPFRGKRNESSYIELIAKKISEIYNMDLNDYNIGAGLNKKTYEKISSLVGKDLSNSYVRVEVICDREGFWLKPHCDIEEKLMSSIVFVNLYNESENLGTDFYDEKLNKVKTESTTEEKTF